MTRGGSDQLVVKQFFENIFLNFANNFKGSLLTVYDPQPFQSTLNWLKIF